ncbi:MAG: PEP-CTERM sorting domain-containing protein [Puniceicoccaceae bacterium]
MMKQTTLTGILVIAAMTSGMVANAGIFSADVSSNNVIQGNFESGSPEVFLTDNNNSRRVGAGGAAGNLRVNVPVLGFVLPILPAGETISSVNLTFTMDTPATTSDPNFDVVVSLMGAADIFGISEADFTQDVGSLGAGNALWGTFGTADVSDGLDVSIDLTSGAAFDQFAALYDVNGNASQFEVFFRLSPSQPIDVISGAEDNDRYNLGKVDNFPILRSLEITTIPEPSTMAALFGLMALGLVWVRKRR